MTTVMVVDDAAFMRLMLKRILLEAGFDIVAEAEDGAEAIRLYRIHKPDLVTMDITMPGLDGISAVKEIVAFDAGARIIVCSAMGQKQAVLQAIHAGAKDFIVKPFQNAHVLAALRGVLEV